MDCCCNHHHNHRCHRCDCKHDFIDCHCSPFHLRLSGLQGNLNFQLFRFKGCPVKIKLECGEGESKKIEGKICNVGTDFVDIRKSDKTVTTVPLNRICKIYWPDKDCSPCNKCGCHKCHCHKCRPDHCNCD